MKYGLGYIIVNNEKYFSLFRFDGDDTFISTYRGTDLNSVIEEFSHHNFKLDSSNYDEIIKELKTVHYSIQELIDFYPEEFL